MGIGSYLHFPFSGRAFGGVGDADVLEYLTNTDFDLLEPANNTLQWGFYHPDNVWSVSDTITIGGTTVGVVAATGVAGSGFVTAVDLDSALTAIPAAGNTATNGTTAQTLTKVVAGVSVGGTGVWGTINGRPAWNPQGDHSLIIPNALAAPYFGMADRDGFDMCMVWRQLYQVEDPATAQYLLDFGSRKTGAESGGYSYRPSVTTAFPRVQVTYGPLGGGSAVYVTGAKANYVTDYTVDECVCMSYQQIQNLPRIEMGIVGDGRGGNYPVGAYFDVGNGFGAVDLEQPLSGGQHGFDLRLFGRSDASGAGFEGALGGGLNDYLMRDLIIYFPEEYAGGHIKSLATGLAARPYRTVAQELGLN